MLEGWPLVGRDDELDTVTSALVGPGATGVVITGDAGVGKTRLAREALDWIEGRGHRVEHIVATEAARPIPFGAFAHLVPSQKGAVDLDELVHRVAAELLEQVAERGLVLGVDDVHLLDDASTRLLPLVSDRAGVRLVATVRTEGELPVLASDLWRDESVVRIELGPLSREAVTETVHKVVGSKVAPATIDRIWELSRGNPLFLRELVTVAATEDESLRSFVISQAGEPGRRLRELIETRMAKLEPDAREALEVVALGEPLPPDAARALTDPDALAALERRGLVESAESPEGEAIRLVHPLYGEMLRDTIPTLTRRSVLHRLADALESRGELAPHELLRVTSWRLELGEVGETARMLAAGQEAMARLDHRLAERLARAVGPREHPLAGLLLGGALVRQERAQEAEDVLVDLEPSEPAEDAWATNARAMNLFWGLGRSEEALTCLRDAEERLAGDPEWQAECRATRSLLLLFTGQIEAADALAATVLAQSHAREPARLMAMVTATVTSTALGRADRTLALDDEWFDRADRHRAEVPQAFYALRANVLTAYLMSGRFLDAESYAEERLGFGSGDLPMGLEALVHGGRGWALGMRGHAVASLEALTRSVEMLREADWAGLRAWVCAGEARVAVFADRLDVARSALEEAEEAYAVDPQRSAFSIPDTLISRAWLAAAEGDRDAALEHARTAAAITHTSLKPVCVEALVTIARLGEPGETIETLDALAAACEGPGYGAYAAFARALADDDPGALEEAGEALEAMGADLLGAEAAVHAARARAHAGQRFEASQMEERARVLLERCGNPVSPALQLSGVETAPVSLTDREREVALMAAQGVSTRELAERLGISVRTAETHLGRIYRKLDVKGREELAEAMRR